MISIDFQTCHIVVEPNYLAFDKETSGGCLWVVVLSVQVPTRRSSDLSTVRALVRAGGGQCVPNRPRKMGGKYVGTLTSATEEFKTPQALGHSKPQLTSSLHMSPCRRQDNWVPKQYDTKISEQIEVHWYFGYWGHTHASPMRQPLYES